MKRSGIRRMLTAAGGLALFAAAAAQAAVPPNDNWAGRVTITGLPFTHHVSQIQLATNEPTDPELFCVIFGRPMPGSNSVWYEYTTGPADEYVDIAATDYDSIVGVFEGSPADGFAMVRGGCNDDDGDSFGGSSRLFGLRLKANTRYAIDVATYTPNADPTMNLTLTLTRSRVYTVTKTDDTGDAVCDADCSLRDAFTAMNVQPGAIVVPAGTYVLTQGLVAEGPGAVYGAGMNATVIDANGTGTVLTHRNGARETFALHDLTLTGGVSTTQGGAFHGNLSAYYAFDRVAALDSQGANGGGISIPSGAATASLVDSLVSGNTASGSGGGVYFPGCNLETTGTSIVGNQAVGGAGSVGGGLYLSPYRDARLKNTTISGNTATGRAGGVYLEPDSQWVRTVVNNSSIVNNVTGLVASPQNGGLLLGGDTVTAEAAVITNTVLAGNHSTLDPAVIFDCGKTDTFVLATGYDLVQAPNGCTFTATGDVTAVDPQLQPLATHLPLPVHVPAEGSSLVDAGNPGAVCERIDARGVVRPVDGDADGTPRCDIGAVEWTAGRDRDRIFADGFDTAN